MKKITKNVLSIIVPVVVITLIFIGDNLFYLHTGIIKEILWIREILLVGALTGLIPWMTSMKWLHRQSTSGRFWMLLLIILLMYAISILSDNVVGPFIGGLSGYLLITVTFTMLSVLILIQLRDLIYFKRRKNTARVFSLLVISIVIVSLYGGLSSKSFQQMLIPAMLPIGLAVFNAFRISWITYLTRPKKYMLLFICLLIAVGASGLQETFRTNPISEYSYTLEAFARLSITTLAIYSIFGFVGLLFQLPTAAIFDRKMKEVASLSDLSRAVSSVLDFDRLSEMIADFTAQSTGCDFVWLVQKEEGSKRFYLSSAKGLSDRQQQNMNFRFDEGTSGWIYAHAEPLVAQDVHREELTRHLRLWNADVRSLVGYPLISNKEVIGILYAAKDEEWGFDNDDIILLSAFVNHIVIAIENARLVEGSLEKERLQHELRLAQEVQLSLLPQKMPVLAEGFDIAAASMPANEVGGDYFDFIELENERIGLVIGDVSGKGASAAFYMAEIKGIIQAFSRIYDSPKKILCDVNNVLYKNMDRKFFISLTYAIIDTKERTLSYARAGHQPILHLKEKINECIELLPPGIGLGLDEGEIFSRVIEEETVPLEGAELFFFYTDGVTDAMNADREPFGEERIHDALIKYAGLGAEKIKAKMIRDIWTFVGNQSVHDDITMIVVKVG